MKTITNKLKNKKFPKINKRNFKIVMIKIVKINKFKVFKKMILVFNIHFDSNVYKALKNHQIHLFT